MRGRGALQIEDGSRALLRAEIHRYLAEDHSSAVHALVPRVEDVLSQQMNAWAWRPQPSRLPAGEWRPAPIQGFLRRSAADGTTVEALLGTPLFRYVEATFPSPSRSQAFCRAPPRERMLGITGNCPALAEDRVDAGASCVTSPTFPPSECASRAAILRRRSPANRCRPT